MAWTLFTVILWIGSLRIHGAMAFTFTTLLIGFILLDLAHFGYPGLTVVAGYELMICALAAWYMLAGIILNGLYGRTILSMGKPWAS